MSSNIGCVNGKKWQREARRDRIRQKLASLGGNLKSEVAGFHTARGGKSEGGVS